MGEWCWAINAADFKLSMGGDWTYPHRVIFERPPNMLEWTAANPKPLLLHNERRNMQKLYIEQFFSKRRQKVEIKYQKNKTRIYCKQLEGESQSIKWAENSTLSDIQKAIRRKCFQEIALERAFSAIKRIFLQSFLSRRVSKVIKSYDFLLELSWGAFLVTSLATFQRINRRITSFMNSMLEIIWK